jgi:hypothetical protein
MGSLSVKGVSSIADRPASWPNLGPLPELDPWDSATHYVLPLRWSLHYALTEKQWRDFRERLKKLSPEWDRCACPKRCKAKTLDEEWDYDQATHTKRMVGAAFICGGCHWLKTPPFRIKTWLELQSGIVPASSEPPHIIHCLGWNQHQLDALRVSDLRKRQVEADLLARIDQQVRKGTAAIVPAPPERLSSRELKDLVKPGQIMVVPWRIDLAGLAQYGYSASEIAEFEERMYALASKRMNGE